ncbi:MAG: ATP-dependent 6-phosphofructokinase [Fibromonadaceae bacterium]|jgi:6-phosphofructokinase 1|nr:ATP-dependent 6-phosphofructokinase [Fibromonadaceae bacterium]
MNLNEICAHPKEYNLNVSSIGKPELESPVKNQAFVDENSRVSLATEIVQIESLMHRKEEIPSLEIAGPRKKLFHDPVQTRVAIVTCGGLCPGLNNVIKGLVEVLAYDYGVRQIFGIRYGYQGLNPHYGLSPVNLTVKGVDDIHEAGGTVLGSSRGGQDPKVMVDTLMQRLNVNILFCVGGDGTLRGAQDIVKEITKRKAPISVVCIPKTIDNDLNLIDRTFGFDTCVQSAAEIIKSAHVEANGIPNGLGLVKIMGRDSGFIAAHASLASSVTNFCLIPEVPLVLEGHDGLFKALDRRFFKHRKDHAVMVVAEGAGQDLFNTAAAKDASGNVLKHDIGHFLVDKIAEHFKKIGKVINIKYIDPSYIIRSIPANSSDAIFCFQLAENAVHAAMAGQTDLVIGSINGTFVLVPLAYVISERKKIDTEGALWHAVIGSTRQNDYFFDNSFENELPGRSAAMDWE